MSGLDVLLDRMPVMVEASPLLPLALDPSIKICSTADEAVAICDQPAPQPVERIIVQGIDVRRMDRFAVWRDQAPPSPATIDRFSPQRLEYARTCLLNQVQAGAAIAERFLQGGYDCGFAILVDGLSYFDCIGWSECPQPCFVDGPSITAFGFPQITQDSGLVATLNRTGRYRLRAYTYWERNALSERIFAGVPVEQVRTVQEALRSLRTESLHDCFCFLLREGLDELVHRRRELSATERAATVQSVHDDLEALIALVRSQQLHALIALIADHGIVWRDETAFKVVEYTGQSWHGRYSDYPPVSPEVATRFGSTYCYHPGLLCRHPRSTEAGFHGGLSARESLVPFLMMEGT